MPSRPAPPGRRATSRRAPAPASVLELRPQVGEAVRRALAFSGVEGIAGVRGCADTASASPRHARSAPSAVARSRSSATAEGAARHPRATRPPPSRASAASARSRLTAAAAVACFAAAATAASVSSRPRGSAPVVPPACAPPGRWPDSVGALVDHRDRRVAGIARCPVVHVAMAARRRQRLAGEPRGVSVREGLDHRRQGDRWRCARTAASGWCSTRRSGAVRRRSCAPSVRACGAGRMRRIADHRAIGSGSAAASLPARSGSARLQPLLPRRPRRCGGRLVLHGTCRHAAAPRSSSEHRRQAGVGLAHQPRWRCRRPSRGGATPDAHLLLDAIAPQRLREPVGQKLRDREEAPASDALCRRCAGRRASTRCTMLSVRSGRRRR